MAESGHSHAMAFEKMCGFHARLIIADVINLFSPQPTLENTGFKKYYFRELFFSHFTLSFYSIRSGGIASLYILGGQWCSAQIDFLLRNNTIDSTYIYQGEAK
jgi:hypothetical protein